LIVTPGRGSFAPVLTLRLEQVHVVRSRVTLGGERRSLIAVLAVVAFVAFVAFASRV